MPGAASQYKRRSAQQASIKEVLPMKQKKPVTLLNVLLNALAALVWTANCAVLMVYNTPAEFLLGLDILCAVIWWISFTVALIRWRRGRREQETDET